MDLFAGRMMLYALLSAFVAAPLTVGLLSLYRRSVVRGMQLDAGAPHGDRPVAAASSAGCSRLTLKASDAAQLAALGVYSAAGATFALAFAMTLVIQTGEFHALEVVFWFPLYFMPVLIAGWLVLPAGWFRRLFTAIWAAVSAAMVLVPLIVAGQASVIEVLFVLVVPTVPAAVLILMFMTRRVRAAGPLVLTIVTGSVLGWNLILDAAEASSHVFGILSSIENALSGPVLVLLIVATGSVVGAVAMWPVLRAIGLAYEHKFMSDQTLAIDVVFLWFAVFYGLEMGAESWPWVVSGAVAFVLYRTVVFLGFAVLEIVRAERPHADILLLRPFALRRRSELLFDYLSRVWLPVGAVHMIAGPDLVTATVSPPEFLVFLSGRMSRRFIHDSADLGAHLSGLDLAPDPDGRYRVNQLFCRDNVWRDAMRGLAGVSTAVLMDLRGFTPVNRGCAYEIGELVRGVPLERVVFAVDETTDRSFLDALFEEIRAGLPAESPNAWPGSIASRIVSVDDSVEGRRRLLRVLADSIPA